MYSPLSENMTTIVKSRAIRVIGLILGMNFVSYQSAPFELEQREPGDHPGQEGNAEIDEDALGDLPMVMLTAVPLRPNQVGKTVMKT